MGKNESRFGQFHIGENEFPGDLRIAGSETRLTVYSDRAFTKTLSDELTIVGRLFDANRVSFIHCIFPLSRSFTIRAGGEQHSAQAFPHYVVEGDRHILPGDECVTGVNLLLTDAMSLFHNFDTFGVVVNASAIIQDVIKADPLKATKNLTIGSWPMVMYYTGQQEIIRFFTEIGELSAWNATSGSSPGPDGVGLKNKIKIGLKFECPVNFDEACIRASALRHFLALLLGRQQDALEFDILVTDSGDAHEALRVHVSTEKHSKVDEHSDERGRRDSLIYPIQNPDEFERVCASWFQSNAQKLDSRGRFFSSFFKALSYDIDRLVSAANMFDILPTEFAPTEKAIPSDLLLAKQKAKEMFKKLPKSNERDGVLGALGRIGTASLRDKVLYRASKIPSESLKLFPEIDLVIGQAVACRNHYVHGTPTVVDYVKYYFETTGFFTDVLEFVFATSDLVECGWDMDAWTRRHSRMSHPFDVLRFNYAERLTKLKELLSAATYS